MRLRLAAIPVAAALAVTGGMLLARPAVARPRASVPSYSVRFTPVVQRPNWCVPATSSMFLSAFGIHVSQDTLARQMHSTQNGTSYADQVRVMNAHLAPRYRFVFTAGHLTAAQLAVLLRLNLRAGEPVIVSVLDARLPWRHRGVDVHELLVSGIRGTTVTVFDPSFLRQYRGFHQLSAATLDRAMGQAGVAFRSE